MSLRFYYDDPDAGTVEFTDHVKQGIGQVSIQTKAEQGEVATSSITIEDPDGEFNFRGLRKVWIEEDTATFKRIATGWAWVRTFERGDYYRTNAARQITMQFQDINHLIWRKVMAGSDTDRPGESDVERAQWLFSTGEAADIADVSTYLFTGDPVAMDPNPDTGYNGQMFQMVLDDIAQQSGKNYFALDHYNGSAYVAAFWYGADSVPDFVADISISNDLDDIDVDETWAGTVFPPNEAATLNRDPSRVYSGVFGNFDGGYTYQSRAATIEQFANRDTTASWPNVKTLATAQDRAHRYLVTLAEEQDAITASILVCLAQVNDVRAGQRIDVKFTHMPGYEDFVTCRVVTKTVTDVAPDLYEIELELLPIGPSAPAPNCTTILSGLTATDTGQVGGPGDDTHYAPLSVSPASPSVYPSAVVTGMWAENGLAAIGHQPIAINDDFTATHTNHTGIWDGHSQYPTLAVLGYHHIAAGSPGDASLSWAGTNPVESYRSISVAIPTSATSPVNKSADGGGTGSTVTLDNAGTPGNIWIAYRFVETSGWVAPPTGWTSLGQWFITHSAPGQMYLQVCAKCIDATDAAGGTSLFLGNHSKTHWQFVQEWALT